MTPRPAELWDITRPEALATSARYAAAVGSLRCFRGIDTLSALILIVELDDPRRFASAPA